MNNQKGEIVTGVMVGIMAVMMVFGMVFMHGGHDHGKNTHSDKVQQQEHSNHNGHKEAK